MTDQEAIEIAKRYVRLCVERYGYGPPIVRIPPAGAIDEITTVNLRDRDKPVVTREPSSNYRPGNARARVDLPFGRKEFTAAAQS